MPAERNPEYDAVRVAYELGRIRWASWAAVGVVSVVGIVGVCTSGPRSLYALPLTLAAWVFALWRGRVFLRGALYGLAGGVVTSLLPLSILRPCCAVMRAPGVDCCTMPGACLAAGAVVGLVLAAVVPYGKASWWRTAAGMVLGMTSVAVLKCATLFAGEAVGLVGGLLAGLAASTAARIVLGQRFV
jgi:hypothetical protein